MVTLFILDSVHVYALERTPNVGPIVDMTSLILHIPSRTKVSCPPNKHAVGGVQHSRSYATNNNSSRGYSPEAPSGRRKNNKRSRTTVQYLRGYDLEELLTPAPGVWSLLCLAHPSPWSVREL